MEQSGSSTRAGIDRRDAEGEYRRMVEPIHTLEKSDAVLATEMAGLRATCATKEDIAASTARILENNTNLIKWGITWVTTVVMLTSAAVDFIARNVH